METKEYLLKLDQESKIIMYYYGYTIEKKKITEKKGKTKRNW